MCARPKSNPKLYQIFGDYFNEINAIDPMNTTFNGVNGYNDQLPADDEDHLKKIHHFNTKYSNLAEPYHSQNLNKEDQITLAILENGLQIALKTEKWHQEYTPINQFFSILMFMASWAQNFCTIEF